VVVSPSPGAQPYELFGGQLFYTGREPGSDNLDLFVKDPKLGTRKLFDVGKLRAANNGKPYAINYFQASPDGTKVALGLSEGGSEDASLFVYDVATGARTAGPVDRAEYASPSWTDDGRILYFMRLAAPKPGEAPTAKYLNATTQVWDLKSAPRDVIGTAAANAARLNLTPEEFPIVQLFAGAPFAVFDNVNGVQHEQELWLAPLAEAAGTNAPWKLLAARSDNVTAMDVRGEEIYLLSHQDAPTFKVLALRAGQKLTDAITLVPPQPDRVLESIYAARGVVFMREGADSGFCHVRGGGELGEAWRLGGKDANKPNT
jgi:prolyl oligopeptidase